MTPLQQLIHDALKFADWAAGEGLTPIPSECVEGPEDFLMKYSISTEDEEWGTLAARVSQQIGADDAIVSEP